MPLHSLFTIWLARSNFITVLASILNLAERRRFLLVFYAGSGYLNLILQPSDGKLSWWGRVIFHVKNVDAVYQRIVKSGYKPSSEPEDATWGERYFHIQDPDGHELSFARPIDGFNK